MPTFYFRQLGPYAVRQAPNTHNYITENMDTHTHTHTHTHAHTPKTIKLD